MVEALAIRWQVTEAVLPDRGRGVVDDLRLIRGTLRGRSEDFGVLVDRYQGGLYAFVLSQLRDPAAAEDVVQVAFLRAFSRLRTFRGDASFKTWIHQIAINECRARYRDEQRRSEIAIEDVGEEALRADDHDPAGRIEHARLHRWIDRLPPRQKSVVGLRVFSDLPFRDIARIEGISENAAKVSYHHAVKKLRGWLS